MATPRDEREAAVARDIVSFLSAGHEYDTEALNRICAPT